LSATTATALRDVVAAEHRYPPERFTDRGIVMCAGGARLITCAWVAINVLRRVVDCALPIELWHIGPSELGEVEASLFRPLGVEVVDALEMARSWPARKLGGWELKAYALVHSRFQEVLLLDADNVAVSDPAFLFELPQYAATGAVVWPDLVRLARDSPIWELCGVPFRSEPAWESGQLLIDKSRCWHAVQIALHMNMHSESFYEYTHGDKETFHLAWILAGTDWAMPDHPARRTPTGIYQRDFDGRLIFQHRSQAKWRLSGVNPLAENFRHQEQCLRFIDELRDRWTGRVDAVPERADRDLEVERTVSEIRWFSLRRPGAEDRLLELLPGSRVGIGSGRERSLRWYVREHALILDGAAGALPPLSAEADGRWSAADRTFELVPAPEAGLDIFGVTAAAVLEALVGDRLISEAEAVATLATLARIGDLEDAFQRARSRWQGNDEALRAIHRAARRVSMGAPGAEYRGEIGYEALE
jgi:hypothetical protein